jgi:ATP-binding cassette subfamily F protein 3
MRHALTMAIQEYKGALVIVSHERHLLKACCDDFLLVADGKAQAFEGDLDDYAKWLRDWRATQEAAASKASTKSTAKNNTKPAAAPLVTPQNETVKEAPKKGIAINKEAQKAFAKAEKQLSELQNQLSALTEKLNDNTLYEAKRKAELDILLVEKAALESRLSLVEEEWMHWSEVLEQR